LNSILDFFILYLTAGRHYYSEAFIAFGEAMTHIERGSILIKKRNKSTNSFNY